MKKEKLANLIAILFLVLSSILMLNAYYISSIYYELDFDSGWNATVAKNFLETFLYKTSYPNLIFNEKISTGEPVILLTSLIYKIFSISRFTTILIPSVMTVLSLIFIYLFYSKIIKSKLLLAVSISLLFLSSYPLYICSIGFYGETFSLFTIVFGLYIIETKNRFSHFVFGICLALSFISKLCMLFFVIPMVILFVIDAIFYKNKKVTQILQLLCGIFVILLIQFLFRFTEFRFNIKRTFDSYYFFITEMLDQSQIDYNNVILNLSVNDRISNMGKLGFTFIPPIITASIPIIIYIIVFVRIVIFKKDFYQISNNVLYMAVSASAIFIYYILFGTGAFNAKRLVVFNILLNSFYLYLIMNLIQTSFINKNSYFGLTILFIILFNIFPLKNVKDTYLYFDYKNTSNAKKYENMLLKTLNEIKNNGRESEFYTFGFNCNVAELFLDIKTKEILKGLKRYKDSNEDVDRYLITEGCINNDGFDLNYHLADRGYKIVKYNDYEIDYTYIDTRYKPEYLDMYSVYKIVKK